MWFVRFPWPTQGQPVDSAAGAFRSDTGDEGCCYVPDGPRPAGLPPGAVVVRLR